MLTFPKETLTEKKLEPNMYSSNFYDISFEKKSIALKKIKKANQKSKFQHKCSFPRLFLKAH